MDQICIDFSKTLRKMKPMHGVDNGPLTCNFSRDARHLFKEAGIPISRLHDTEYPFGSGEFIDVDCIFKNFKDDENDPENYNFALSDEYIKAILECGTKVIYRLGCTIEHQPVKRHIGPPKDYAKWARICEHIIRHYNEGWADGYHMGITYWEIWNEPNHAEQDRKMWGGSAEDFAHFYTVAAEHLKKCFPDLMIGGPAFSSPESEFVYRFFNELTKDGAHPPMDFYSWHGYISTVTESVRRSQAADRVLASYGYTGIESIYDEWNYVKSWRDMGPNYALMNGQQGMAFDAAQMCAMQDTNCTAMCYYDAQYKFAGAWCGLFKMGSGQTTNGGAALLEAKKPFYAFKAFNEVYRLGAKDAEAEIGTQGEKIADEVELTNDGQELYAVASLSADKKKGALLLSNFRAPEEEQVTHEISVRASNIPGKTAKVYLADEEHNLDKVLSFPAGDFTLALRPFTVALVIFE